MSPVQVKDAVQECVNNASGTQRPVEEAYKFVRRLIETEGWNEVDARQVGARAIGVLNALSGRSPCTAWGD